MIYGYARVSTRKQLKGNSIEEQTQELQAQGAEEIVVESYTGAKMDRPKFEQLLKALKEDDTLMVTKLDRFARTAPEACTVIRSLAERGIKVHVLNMGITDNSPMGKLMITILAAFAEFERDMIVERTQSGRAMAREKNADFVDGRPPKYSRKQIAHALDLLKDNSYKTVSEMTGISVSTLQRARRKQNI